MKPTKDVTPKLKSRFSPIRVLVRTKKLRKGLKRVEQSDPSRSGFVEEELQSYMAVLEADALREQQKRHRIWVRIFQGGAAGTK